MSEIERGPILGEQPSEEQPQEKQPKEEQPQVEPIVEEHPNGKEPKEEDGAPRQEGGDDLTSKPEDETPPESSEDRESTIREQLRKLNEQFKKTHDPEIIDKYHELEDELRQILRQKEPEKKPKEEKPKEVPMEERFPRLCKDIVERYVEIYSSKEGLPPSRDPEKVAEMVLQDTKWRFTLTSAEERKLGNWKKVVKQWQDEAVQLVIERLQKDNKIDKPKKVEK